MHITNIHLNYLVDDKYRDRGRIFYENGKVELVHVSENQVDAVVLGDTYGKIYDTKLFKTADTLTGKCTCPAYEEGEGPCKHMAAAALAVMDDNYAPTQEFFLLKEEIEQRQSDLQKMGQQELIAIIFKLEHQLRESTKG